MKPTPVVMLCLFALSICRAEHPLESESDWMAMMLNGQKTGHMHLKRDVYADRVVNIITSSLTLNRAGTSMTIDVVERSTETPDGVPISFYSSQKISGVEMINEGTVENGKAKVVMRGAGNAREQEFVWEDDLLLPEAMRLKTIQALDDNTASFSALMFIPSSLQKIPVTMELPGMDTTDVFGTEYQLQQIVQTMTIGQTRMTGVSWVDKGFHTRKMEMDMLGMTFTAMACPRECALSENQPSEFFVNMFVDAPSAIQSSQLNGQVTYDIAAPVSGMSLNFPESSEQSFTQLDDGSYRVVVTPLTADPGSPLSNPISTEDRAEYLSSTRWLETDEPAIQRLARRARGDAETELATMQRLRDFVRQYVSDKNLDVGYASALEVAQNRAGDCTEHALLLAALGRSAGIPTRIATGIAYVDEWLDARQTFVPHAWTQAYVDGRWQSFDAALGQFGAGHIAFSYGDGDPWHFYEGATAIGQMTITSINTLP